MSPRRGRLAQTVEAQPLGAAEGDRQGVGGVARPAAVLHAQQEADHARDLLLVGPAVAGDRGLDLGRSVLADLDAAAGQGRQQGAARLGEHDQRVGVHAMEGGFEDRQVRRMPVEELLEPRGDAGETRRQRKTARTGETAGRHQPERRAAQRGFLQKAVAGLETAGIEPQDDHHPYCEWAARTCSSTCMLPQTFWTSSWSSRASRRRRSWDTRSAGTATQLWGIIASSLASGATPRLSSSSRVLAKSSIGA